MVLSGTIPTQIRVAPVRPSPLISPSDQIHLHSHSTGGRRLEVPAARLIAARQRMKGFRLPDMSRILRRTARIVPIEGGA
jgi:hypothetical protein